jgi:hypothetical protein
MQQALAMADPSEPKYCHCQRISFGEMIACENPGAPGWLLQGCQQAGQQPAEGSTARLPACLPACNAANCTPPCLPADCPYEWFHFGCVGLTEENRPKGAYALTVPACCRCAALVPAQLSAVQMCLPHNPLIFLGLAAAGKWYCRDCKKQLQKK